MSFRTHHRKAPEGYTTFQIVRVSMKESHHYGSPRIKNPKTLHNRNYSSTNTFEFSEVDMMRKNPIEHAMNNAHSNGFPPGYYLVKQCLGGPGPKTFWKRKKDLKGRGGFKTIGDFRI